MARSRASGTTSPKPFAYFDRDSSSWRTSPPSPDEDSTEYSGTWPRSGTTRGGCAFELPKLEQPTTEIGGSASPSLLPTPLARDWKAGTGSPHGKMSRPLSEVALLLPAEPLPARMLPTPTASNPNDGESLASWEERRQKNLAKKINGNGQGMPLGIAVKLLPTPRASDGPKGAPNQRDSAGNYTHLPAAVVHLLPTPIAGDSKNTGNLKQDGTPYGNRPRPTLTDAVRHLLPTPTASDGKGGAGHAPSSTGAMNLRTLVTHLPNGGESTRRQSTAGSPSSASRRRTRPKLGPEADAA